MESGGLPLVSTTLVGKKLAEKGYAVFISSCGLKYVGNRIRKREIV